jgi:hypothetical protein
MKPKTTKKHRRNKKAPHEILHAFFNTHSPGSVESLLWETFRGYAVNGPKQQDGSSVKETEIAALFDDLNDLVAAVYTLNEGGRITNPPVMAQF